MSPRQIFMLKYFPDANDTFVCMPACRKRQHSDKVIQPLNQVCLNWDASKTRNAPAKEGCDDMQRYQVHQSIKGRDICKILKKQSIKFTCTHRFTNRKVF